MPNVESFTLSPYISALDICSKTDSNIRLDSCFERLSYSGIVVVVVAAAAPEVVALVSKQHSYSW